MWRPASAGGPDANAGFRRNIDAPLGVPVARQTGGDDQDEDDEQRKTVVLRASCSPERPSGFLPARTVPKRFCLYKRKPAAAV